MKPIRTLSLLLVAAWPAACVTTNVNQPPSVVERSPGFRPASESVAHRTSGEEDSYFAEASSRDPALRSAARNGEKDENCACRPENQAPGYAPEKDGRPEASAVTTQRGERPEGSAEPGNNGRPEARAEVVVEVKPEQRVNARDAGRDEKPEAAVVASNNANSGNPATTSSGLDLTDYAESGTASWYGRDFDGRPTASGEPFDSRRLTGAHKTLPLGSVIVVKNLDNNKEVILKVNDRGPYVKGRVLDVSEYASEVLNFKEKGLARVSIRVIKKGELNEKGEGATAMFFRRPESGTGGAELEQKGNDRPAATEAQLAQMRREVKTDEDLSRFSIQIGLFNDIENAIRLKNYLGERYGQPASVYARGKDYVVKIGSFNARYPAEQLKSRLEGDGYSGFITGPRH